jgi:two-component system, sporulation sensor kinase E
LHTIARARVPAQLIIRKWDDLLRIAGSLHQGTVSASELLRSILRSTRPSTLARAIAALGCIPKTLLGILFLHIDLLEEEFRNPSEESPRLIPQTFRVIRTVLARLDALVQDYLSLVRVGAVEPSLQNLGAAVQEWTGEVQDLAAQHGVSLELAGLETVGALAFHAGTLRRAVLNVVQNALEAMPQGGTLTLECVRTATAVQLRVADSGTGIPAEHVTRIFEPLYTTKPGGTGMGLYIVQETLIAHGGRVTVESVEGQGSTFTFMLPVS